MRPVALLSIIVLVACIPLSPPSLAAGASGALLEVGTSPLCDYHSIADAIAAAQPGDTVKVQNAVFAEPPLTIDRDLTLAGGYNSADPYSCLTLTGIGRTTFRRSGVAPGPAISITGAAVTMSWFVVELNTLGRGLSVTNAAVTLEHVIVRDNDDSTGGGILSTGSDLTLRDTEVRNNTADAGGGLFALNGSTVVAERSLFRGNQGWDVGAGIYLSGASTFAAIDATSIESNITPMACDYGGGIYATGPGTQVVLDASQVVSNTALQKGGGVYLDAGASAKLRNLASVRENRAFGPGTGAGGGVYLSGTDTSLVVRRASVVSNWADPVGGGIANEGGTVRFETGLVMGNSARDAGGGIYNYGGSLSVSDSYIVSNEATYGMGGGVHSEAAGGALDVRRSWFVLNRTPGAGGAGLYAGHPLVTVERSYFAHNEAIGEGRAIYLSGACYPAASADVVNNLLVDNQPSPVTPDGPPASGSALYVEDMEAALVHNTFANQAPLDTFGIYVGPGSQIAMTNNIVANFYTGIRRLSTSTGTATADHTLFFGNTADYDPGVSSSHEVHGNPAFVGLGDYHITAASAALDAGISSPVVIDFDANSRPWGAAPDIGADEFPPRVSFYLPVVHRH